MINKYYSDVRTVQILIALLKAHGIRKVIASPGTTNIALVASMNCDPFFEIYSSVDERSAAYMACGLAAESGEPVVLSCTEATASRNYLSGMTEAYYRKLPILAITSTHGLSKVGHHIAQVIDRSSIQNDVAKLSIALTNVRDEEEAWDCEMKVNKALLELKRHGGGPVHINLAAKGTSFTTKELPQPRVINRIFDYSVFPDLPEGKIAIFVGAHAVWTKELTEIVDQFCSLHNAVVFCDHTSNYKGKYRLLFSLVTYQEMLNHQSYCPQLIIHIGEVSGDYPTIGLKPKQVWRVSEDGEIRDTFKRLRYVFEMSEKTFFTHFIQSTPTQENNYFRECKHLLNELRNTLPELPFSNIWMASQLAPGLPENSTIHFGILNSLRSWNFFEIPQSVSSASNVGGFGIDGGLSTLVGASLANSQKLYFGILGDLAFFYDMNVLGNRHIGTNLRILLVNNGKGTEFRQYSHPASQFGDHADHYIAAGGHYGNKSKVLIKHYAEDLGFEYLTASTKEEFKDVYKRFLTPKITDRPMLLEVFTHNEDESKALKAMRTLRTSTKGLLKQTVKEILGDNAIRTLGKVIKR